MPVLPAWAADPGEEKNIESPKKQFEIELDEAIISVPMQEKLSGSARPVGILKGEGLRLKVGNTIGETLRLEPGINSRSHGPNVGLPVIRGQSGPRVRVLNNGLGANDASQVSPDHASSVVPLLADRIEILRGPATLLYGSGAIGGVVNVIDNRIPDRVPDKFIEGSLEQRFNSVSRETSTAIKVEGGKGYFAYHFDGFIRDSSDVRISGQAIDVTRARVSEPGLSVTRNTRGFLPNSASHSKGGSLGFSLVGESGFIGFSGNRLENDFGVPPEGTEDGESARVALEQNKYDLKGELRNPVDFIETIRFRLGFTDYEHREMVAGGTEALFARDTFEGRLEIPHVPLGPLTGVVGLQAISSNFSARDVADKVTLVPASRSNNFGVFVQESFDLGPVETRLGVRVEQATVDPRGFDNPFRSFTPISASVSGLWNIDEHHSLNLAFTRSERAPQVQELFFRGFHEATRAFERGNPNLGLETSYNLDLGYKFLADWVVAEINLFHNRVEDYIFRQRTGVFIAGAPELLSRQAAATFMGYEAKFIFPVMDNSAGLVDWTLFSDFTRGRLVNRDDVPQMPPLRWGFQVDHSLGDWSTSLRLTRGERQRNPGGHEADTPGYVLLNLSTHYHLADVKGAEVLLFARGNNLLNENIRNATSFLRNFAPEPGRGAELGVRVNFQNPH